MITVETRIEGRRGCGYRKPGGIYLMGPPSGHPCCKLPFELTVCPCCGVGIKPTRGWTWVDAGKILAGGCAAKKFDKSHPDCVLSHPETMGKAGLLWIGEQFYKTPKDFSAEADSMGVSRRISTVPKDFKLGETWVLLAHRKAIQRSKPITDGLLKDTGEEIEFFPAIFTVFKPTALEYVVTGTETQEDLERLVKRGLTPVVVNPVERRAYGN
jgi:hypothetical protein